MTRAIITVLTVIVFNTIVLNNIATGAGDDASREAGKHFQRGVDLYNDGDFRGALVEFKKAYSLWPRANTLYDIGQTEYQIMDYAAALKTMERFLAETGSNAPHHAEVENTVEVLRGRVGSIVLVSDATECEATIDDQSAGTTPLRAPVLVAVGPHRVSLACTGRATVSKRLEVAAGEVVRVPLNPPAPPPATVAGRSSLLLTPTFEPPKKPTRSGMVIGWSVSSLLSAGVLGFGVAALVNSERLNTLRQTYPVTRQQLDSQAGLTTGLAITTDVLMAATIVGIGVSTYLTVKYNRDRKLKLSFTGSGASVSAS